MTSRIGNLTIVRLRTYIVEESGGTHLENAAQIEKRIAELRELLRSTLDRTALPPIREQLMEQIVKLKGLGGTSPSKELLARTLPLLRQSSPRRWLIHVKFPQIPMSIWYRRHGEFYLQQKYRTATR
jgi:hypothetical protein